MWAIRSSVPLTRFDPNDTPQRRESPEGLAFTPLGGEKGKRVGPREFLLRVKKESSGQSDDPVEFAGDARPL